jgi:3-methyl-2-oxobutanoate hydroxymethyltransferase
LEEKMKKKKTIQEFYMMKEKGEQITYITSYDYPTATFAEKAGLDMILVGDSLGMCVYGYEGTMPVTMDMMIVHSEAVRRGAPNTFVIGDMPFLSYQTTDEAAVENAGRFFKEARMDAVKLEGGVRVASRIKAIVDAGMLVMGHIGLTPQSSSQLGGFKAQGRTLDSAKAQVEDALAVQEAGAAMILLEAIPPEVSGYIRDLLSIPVLSIGAGPYCDGQLLIVSDMLGVFEAFTPKFVKRYAEIAKISTEALTAYVQDVRSKAFPEPRHIYPMIPEELAKFKEWVAAEKASGAKKIKG